MEFFKDGKYIIGFLVGVICSFIAIGGINNYKDGDVVAGLSDKQLIEEVLVGENEVENQETLTVNVNEDGLVETAPVISNNQSVSKPEDPHSPELQRLALILREVERMMGRLEKDMVSLEAEQQTANILSQTQ